MRTKAIQTATIIIVEGLKHFTGTTNNSQAPPHRVTLSLKVQK